MTRLLVKERPNNRRQRTERPEKPERSEQKCV